MLPGRLRRSRDFPGDNPHVCKLSTSDLIAKINPMITDSSSLKRMFVSSEKGATKMRKISNRYTRKVFLNKLVELGKLFLARADLLWADSARVYFAPNSA